MSSTTVATALAPTPALRTTFAGLAQGELFKIIHLRITWVMTALYAVAVVVVQLIWAAGQGTAGQLRSDTFGAMLNFMEGDLSVLRILSGIFILILTAHVIGLEYQLGTIRILLARGIGRLQLLGAKVLAIAVVSLALLALGLLIEVGLGGGINLALAGGLPLRSLPSDYWRDVWLYLLCVLISMGATLLLGVAASVVGRSLAVGLTVGLCWFAVDNLGLIVVNLAYQFTHSDFWRNITGFFLGPLLNRLPNYLVPARHLTTVGPHGPTTISVPVDGFGVMPLVSVSGGHALAVIAAYSVIFAAGAVSLTWRRDVLE
jgi:ABC-type transport system involved in multi-copper enzyme maturation permease subunit